MRRIGFHTSIAGGIPLALERARNLKCNTVQIFSHNPRGWRICEISEDDLKRFKELKVKYEIEPVFIHTSYLINLASSDSLTRRRSIELLVKELDISDRIGADYLILHPGSDSLKGEEAGRWKAIEALKKVTSLDRWNTKLLLENTAGERGDISSKVEDLALIINAAHSELIGGVCLDTCHAFSAGYNIATPEGIEETIEEIDTKLGLDKVKLIHLNDSKREFNAGVDRHEHIGRGYIGIGGFKTLVNHPKLKNIPLILETPKDNERSDKRNLKVLKSIITLSTLEGS